MDDSKDEDYELIQDESDDVERAQRKNADFFSKKGLLYKIE